MGKKPQFIRALNLTSSLHDFISIMRLPSSTTSLSLFHALCRHFSSNPKLPSLTKIPSNYRSQAIQQAQEVLTDYLHSTRALPFTYAEHIGKNSIHSLSELMSKVDFSSINFRKSLQKFLRYNPINEFGFFYESIGIDYLNVSGYLKPNVHFFSDDSTALDAACALAGFGFPWDKLGRFYEEKVSIFDKKPEFLVARLHGLHNLGFSKQQVVGICLVFPFFLNGEVELSGEIDPLLDDLKRVFVDFDLRSCIVRNVDACYEVCRKIKVFYDLGIEKGEVGELVGKSKCIFVDYPERILAEKVEFFRRFGVGERDVALLLIHNPEILSIKLDNRVISLLSFLKHFGLQPKKLKSIEQRYSYVFGRHKMVNLPYALRAMNLHQWFFNKMRCGNYQLLANYDLSSPEDGVDENYIQNLEKIKCSRTFSYTITKLNFFHVVGFGENSFVVKLLADVHGSACDLQERFDFLLNEGIEFSKLCKMIVSTPKILNQETDSLKQKINFLREEMGLSLQSLEDFPAYLMYNLETRVKPRYKFHLWLIEQGWCTKKYTLASIIAISEKGFMQQLSCIHPSAPQLWAEHSEKRNQIHNLQKSAS